MPAPWKPNPNLRAESPTAWTPVVPKSWDGDPELPKVPEVPKSFSDEVTCSSDPQGGLEKEQVEPEQVSQAHFLERQDSFDWDQEGGAQSEANARQTSQAAAEVPLTQLTPTLADVDATAAGIGEVPLTQPYNDSEPAGEADNAEPLAPTAACAEAASQLIAPTLPCDESSFPCTQLYCGTQSCDDALGPCTQRVDAEAAGRDEGAGRDAAEAEAETETPARRRRPRGSDDESAAKGRIAGETVDTIGHTLQPPQQGLRVAVVGDGWGGRNGGYEAVVTEADRFTFTVVATSGNNAWTESHVLKEHCIFLSEAAKPSVRKRKRRD